MKMKIQPKNGGTQLKQCLEGIQSTKCVHQKSLKSIKLPSQEPRRAKQTQNKQQEGNDQEQKLRKLKKNQRKSMKQRACPLKVSEKKIDKLLARWTIKERRYKLPISGMKK